jgi:hypothetical protein
VVSDYQTVPRDERTLERFFHFDAIWQRVFAPNDLSDRTLWRVRASALPSS